MTIIDPALDENELDIARVLADGFMGAVTVDPEQMLFQMPKPEDVLDPEDDEDRLDFWDDVDFWTGESKGDERIIIRTQRDEKAYQIAAREKHQAAEEQGIDPWAQAAVGVTQSEKKQIKSWMHIYDNGRIPDRALDYVDGIGFLRPDAADSIQAMRKAARKAGINLSGGAYRSYEEQAHLHEEKPTLAAPAGKSNHGWALAVDFANLEFGSKEYKWLMKHGPKYGWHHPEWAQADGSKPEPWHWEFSPRGEMEYKPVDAFRRKRDAREVRSGKARQVGAKDIDTPSSPLSSPMTFANIVMGLAVDEPTIVRRRDGKIEVDPTKPKLEFVPKQYRKYFYEAAQKTGLSARLLALVSKRETSFSEDVWKFQRNSSAGAVGPMQVMPLHTKTYGDKFMRDARTNVIVGAKILASYISGLGLRDGLAAYNAGPGNISAGYGYADEILSWLRAERKAA